MAKQKLILTIALILLVGNLFLGYRYFALRSELKMTEAILERRQINEGVLNFTQLFIKEVLKAEAEVDFETRLKLETAVRGLGDDEILAKWQTFTESQTEDEAQSNVKNLLELLASRIKVL